MSDFMSELLRRSRETQRETLPPEVLGHRLLETAALHRRINPFREGDFVVIRKDSPLKEGDADGEFALVLAVREVGCEFTGDPNQTGYGSRQDTRILIYSRGRFYPCWTDSAFLDAWPVYAALKSSEPPK